MKKKIKFLTTQTVEAQGVVKDTFNAGEIYELELSSAKRWLRRNVATEVLGQTVPEKSKAVKQEPEKPVRKYRRKPPVTSTTVTPESDDSDTGGRPESDAK